MPIRPMAAVKKSGSKKSESPPNKKVKKIIPKEEEEIEENVVDLHKEQIDRLIRERDEIRSKLNLVCSKIIENINIENYQNDIDLSKQQPSDISLENLYTMIDEICHYRTVFLNLYQEIDDTENIPVQNKITQLSIENPSLFRKRLTSDQRLTFVVRERDLWKENAQLLQIMYATIVDQLEMGIFKKINIKTNEILRAHRLNLEDVCLIFSSPTIRSINDAQKLREKETFVKEFIESKDQQVIVDFEQENNNNNNFNETRECQNDSPLKIKRNVSFAEDVNVFNDHKEIDPPEIKVETPPKEKSSPIKFRLPLASDTLVDQMDSNLRMLIIKELSQDSQIERPPSKKMNSTHGKDTTQKQNRTRKKTPEWVELARLIGIDESEIDHWLSQSLQFPAGRVLSTWCNSTTPSPTVVELHSLLSSNELNRLDLARQIESTYNI